ncbi:lysophospholipase L1-like esterase [Conyzicola lurida]|uniref:Lysophospholipase L1-like esterase n=1 Tax=Conyzicola lurida TaxID=1172621 RepID=A0A841ARZ0_9MICO|nr:SGNH/GDSL hydrolase family protein [Conyzicola lurida]MBB5844335.1 lysophospholipase L1-like esterase [Conyzicola lurida]
MRFLGGLLLAGVTALTLGGCSAGSVSAGILGDGSTATPTPTATASPAPSATASDDDPVSIAVVGDSITAVVTGFNEGFTTGTYSADSWLASTVDDDIVFAGGWAVAGARTLDMRNGVAPVSADLLVMLAGTNDVLREEDRQGSLENMVAIADTVGAENVLVLAIPPINAAPERATQFNVDAKALAERHGWTWFDAAAGLRDGGSFIAGLTKDGVHPTPVGQKLMGAAVRAEIEDLRADLG